MPSTHLSGESTPVKTPLQRPPGSARSDAHVPDPGTRRESSSWRALISYISGRQGGSGGGGGLQGGTGGTGEGSTVHYDLKAENIVVKTFTSPEPTPSEFLRIPLGHIDVRSEIRVDAVTGAVRRDRHNEPMTVAMYQGDNAEEVRTLYSRSLDLNAYVFQLRNGSVTFLIIQAFGIHTFFKFMPARVHLEFMLWYFTMIWSPFVNFFSPFATLLSRGPISWRTRMQIGIISAALWLAQANYIFSQLKTISNHEDYMLVKWVNLTLKIGKTMHNPPDGYLFVCSPTDFETGSTSFRWPDCPAYWSLDPSGGNPLSDEEASSLGFPPIMQETLVYLLSWDETVCAGLRKFDECKGFDPESQDVAKKLGFPLYEICVPGKSRELDWTLDEDNESDYPSVYSEEEYSTEDEIESNSYLASSRVEVLTMDNENFIKEFSSDESDCSNSYPDDELTAENEDSLRDLLSHDSVVGQQYSIGELVELVRFGLIVVLGFTALYEYAGVLF
ncbi:hypothetical protein MSAN_01106200 [Mycena sanguinolenta]|uniref:Uncharacterized protein n=1 Tax=Mycena sanguinolenta TaxID=230812 RepID=A0A8H7DAA3_9AGAR|nr:hypothetical protein MSAN_01106200 [Mycena sanguinolenta]